MRALLYGIFFLSGASALIFETLWFHQAGLAFGNSVWASSLVLSGFMGGLALGNALAARYGDRLGNPIRVYAIAELAIGLTGVGLIYLFPVLGAVLAPWLGPFLDHPWVLNPIRLFIAFILLLIPTTAMGITLPLLTKALSGPAENFGHVLGRLYGWNTVGAVVGVVLGELELIRILGVQGTALAAGALNTVAAGAAGWLAGKSPGQTPASGPPVREALPLDKGSRWLAAAFLSGFCLLALEVVWFRFLLLFILGHTVAFALMLGIVLAGIALGGLAASYMLRLWPDAHRLNAPVAFSAGSLCVVSYATFPLVIHPYGTLELFKALDIVHLGLPLMFPVCFLSGVLFTFLGAALRNDLASETATVGALTLTNTIGAAFGSLAGGFFLLPVLGMERSFFLLALLYGGIGVWLLVNGPAPRRIATVAAVVFLLIAALFPFGSMTRGYLTLPVKRFIDEGAPGRIAAIREGLTQTIIYFERTLWDKPLAYRLLTNSYSMSANDYKDRRYMDLFVNWPMAVHPHIKRALLICFGVGNTAKALTDSRGVETIDVVDISRDVLEMSDVVYPNGADNPLHDPRVRVHIEDGRYFLQTTDQRFDLITGEPPPTNVAGVVNLYSREYYQLIYNRLAEGGMVTYWLPLSNLSISSTKAILRAFCDVFEDCSLWNGTAVSLMMVGSRHATGPVSEEDFTRQWNDRVVAPELSAVGVERPEQLGALFIGDADYLRTLTRDTPPLVDNYPKRISAPFEPPEEVARFFAGWMDVLADRERFRTSPLIQGLWPVRMRNDSLPYFDIQRVINAQWYGARSHLGIEDLHSLLTRSRLTTTALWLMGSNSDIQRIVSGADPQALSNPALQYHLGVRFISERNYAAAVEPLSRAEGSPELRDQAFRFRIYALCMSGQTDEAQHLAQLRLAQLLKEKGTHAESLKETDLPPYWVWMKKTFGIDPLAGV
ncbi:MAG TPA: spermidine synthase [Nitrospiria bacterium]|jgi:spermidine synthase|nr:spermidine synthase [Nitrospiria bacterium]